MQKKIIALAVAGLVSGAAFAQSNVTVYGIADAAYVYQGSNINDNVESSSAINDGGWDSSRFGLKGTEDLGNGLSANFVQEFDLNIDHSSGVSTRNSYVSLAGKSWGEVKIGSVGSVHDDYAGYSESGGMAWGNSVVDLITIGNAKNAVEYVSPSFSGLQFKLGASSNYTTTDVEDAADFNNRALFGSAAYANGPLKLALTFDTVDEQSTEWQKDEWMIVGGYDFGVVKVGLGYDRATLEDGNDEATRDAYRATIGAPIGANGNIALSYSRADLEINDGRDDSTADAWGISYSHYLSKRTALYASAYTANADRAFITDAADAGTTGVTSYETGFKMGVRHTF